MVWMAAQIQLTTQLFNQFKEELKTIQDQYTQLYKRPKQTTDYQKYEKQWKTRLTNAYTQIEPTIHQAKNQIHQTKPFGRPPQTPAEQKTLLLFQKDFVQLSSRKMAINMQSTTFLNNIITSHKTIQRAYSDPLVKLIVHNMFLTLVKNKKITHPHVSGDGTGYSLTITRHYRSVCEKRRDGAKTNIDQSAENKLKKVPVKKSKVKNARKLFTYSFAILDLESWMYVGYGASLKSERAAFDAALTLMAECGVEPASMRLDQYYAGQSAAERMGDRMALYLIPKSNAKLEGGLVWRGLILDLMSYPFLFLSQYYLRVNSESGFSADKRSGGWKIWQKLEDRILTAQMIKGVWHNLVWI
jgi:transposase